MHEGGAAEASFKGQLWRCRSHLSMIPILEEEQRRGEEMVCSLPRQDIQPGGNMSRVV